MCPDGFYKAEYNYYQFNERALMLFSGAALFEIFNSLRYNPSFTGKLNFEVQVCHRHEHCPKLHIRSARYCCAVYSVPYPLQWFSFNCCFHCYTQDESPYLHVVVVGNNRLLSDMREAVVSTVYDVYDWWKLFQTYQSHLTFFVVV